MNILDNNFPGELMTYLELLEKGPIPLIDGIKYFEKGEHGYVYRAFGKYCLKTFKAGAEFFGAVECKALELLNDKEYTPRVYAYCDSKYILMEWIEGYTLLEYFDKFGKIPDELFKIEHELLCDMVSSFVSNEDLKLNEHILWLKDDITKVKIIDFGVVDFINEAGRDYTLRFYQSQYEAMKKRTTEELSSVAQRLYICGIDNAAVTKFITRMIL